MTGATFAVLQVSDLFVACGVNPCLQPIPASGSPTSAAEGCPERVGAHPQCVRRRGRAAIRSARPSIRRCAKPCRSPATWGSARTTTRMGTTATPRSARRRDAGRPGPPGRRARPANWRTGSTARSIRWRRMGMLYGRGTQDDKGPLLAALFAVKALMDAGREVQQAGPVHLRHRRRDAVALHQPLQGKGRAAGDGVFARRKVPADLCRKGAASTAPGRRQPRADCTLRAVRPSTLCPTRCCTRASGRMIWRESSMQLGFAYTRKQNGIESQRQSRPRDDPGGRHQRHRPAVHRTARDRHRVQSASISSPRRSGRIPTPRASSASAPMSRPGSSSSTLGKIELGEVEQYLDRLPHPGHRVEGRDCGEAERRGRPVRAGVQGVRLAGADLPALDHFMIETLMRVYRAGQRR